MNLILFILALEGGISGDMIDYQAENISIYYQAEAGIKLDALIFVIYGIGTSGEKHELFETTNLGFKLYVDADYINFGCKYNYNYYTGDDMLTIYMRIESWNGGME